MQRSVCVLARQVASHRPSLARCLAAEAMGFSSPGNTGISEEMKEIGRTDAVRNNEQSHHHFFSEKSRFSSAEYSTSTPAAQAAAQPSDSSPEAAVGDDSRRLGKEGTEGAPPDIAVPKPQPPDEVAEGLDEPKQGQEGFVGGEGGGGTVPPEDLEKAQQHRDDQHVVDYSS